MSAAQTESVAYNRASVLGERLEAYLRDGESALSAADESLFRSFGIYTQRPADAGFFMLRILIPGGELDANQLRVIASLASDYGRGLADVTVRQSIQLHWVRLSYLPDLLQRLRAAGLFTAEAHCNSLRNIVHCPVSGVDEDELFDTSSIASEVSAFFAETAEFAGLPRKFKIAITGCARQCVYPEINDIGIFAVPDYERGGAAFRVRVGGGLSGFPRFGRDLGILAGANEIHELSAAVASALKEDIRTYNIQSPGPFYVVQDPNIEGFIERVESRLCRRLRRAAGLAVHSIREHDRSHVGIHGQHALGMYYIGISTLGGRISSAQWSELADISEEYGSGRVRTANTQDIVLLDVPEWHLQAVCPRLQEAGLDFEPSPSHRSVIACSGIEFCRQAVAETKARAASLCDYIESEIALEEPVRISVTGCPNSCGQHHISDIGLEGSTITIDGMKRESFQVILGGGVGRIESFGRRIGLRIPSEDLNQSVAGLLSAFKELRFNGESFQEFCARHSDDDLVGFISRGASGSRASVAGFDLVDSLDQAGRVQPEYSVLPPV